VKAGASPPCGPRTMQVDATPFAVGQLRRVSPALHGAERRPPSRPPSTFQTVSVGTSVNKRFPPKVGTVVAAPTTAKTGASTRRTSSRVGPTSFVRPYASDVLLNTNIREPCTGEVRGTPLPRTQVNTATRWAGAQRSGLMVVVALPPFLPRRVPLRGPLPVVCGPPLSPPSCLSPCP